MLWYEWKLLVALCCILKALTPLSQTHRSSMNEYTSMSAAEVKARKVAVFMNVYSDESGASFNRTCSRPVAASHPTQGSLFLHRITKTLGASKNRTILAPGHFHTFVTQAVFAVWHVFWVRTASANEQHVQAFDQSVWVLVNSVNGPHKIQECVSFELLQMFHRSHFDMLQQMVAKAWNLHESATGKLFAKGELAHLNSTP